MDAAPPSSTPLLPRLFISAVSGEFKTVRQQVAAVVRQLGYQAVSMDDWPAGHGELRAWLREQIDSCDGLIHLPGLAYGAEPEVHDPAAHGLPADTPHYSYTQYEFLYAQAQGKKTWVIQPGQGCTRDTAPEKLDLPTDPAVADPSAYQSQRRDLQAAWLQKLKKDNHLRHQPKDDKDLQLILHTLRDHAQEMRLKFGDWQDFVADHMRRTEKRQRRMLAIAVGTLVLLLFVGLVVALVKRDSGNTVIKVDKVITQQDEAAKKLTVVENKMDQGLAKQEATLDAFVRERDLLRRVLNEAARRLSAQENLTAAEKYKLALDAIAAEDKTVPSANYLRQLLDEYGKKIEALGDNADYLDRALVAAKNQRFKDSIVTANEGIGVDTEKLKLLKTSRQHLHEAKEQIAIEEREIDKTTKSIRNHKADLLAVKATSSVQSIDYKTALVSYQQRAELYDKEAEPLEWADAQVWVAYMLHPDLARPKEAEPLLREVIRIREEKLGADDPQVAAAINNLGQLLQATNRPSEAEPLLRRALTIFEKAEGADHPNVATTLNNLAALLKSSNRLTDAEPLLRRALKIDETSYGLDHPNVARDLNNLAALLQDTNRSSEAEPLVRRSVKIDETSYSPDHPEVAISLNNLATLLQATNRLTDAEPLIQRALMIDETSYGPDHPRVARDLNNLAQLLQDTNRLSEAESLMQRVLRIDEISYGPDHPNVAGDLNNLATLLQDSNRLSEAEPLMQRALKIDETSNGPESPEVAIRLNNLASLFYSLNRLSDAEPLMRRALKIKLLFQKRSGHQHPNLHLTIANYLGMLNHQKLDAAAIRSHLDTLADDVPIDRAEFAKLWQKAMDSADAKPASTGPFDVTVTEVIATGQGPGLGIKEGDVIRRYHGEEISSFDQLIKLVGETQDESIPLEIQRGDLTLKPTAKPGKLGLRLENKPRAPAKGS